ncbi:prepilin-type N-terminal cleavage/methylation domain-containing protein [Ureibacillus sinduriensis]|uniref:Prepilin-type N-terminal cleavage/methylation domain-containing protein n=1 Tax=Ureibacillus sinduriensis BLB-1 = JCM 15800 TaxID=1384057 RepID=A0A0A3IGS4_9BACL|nr:prepilin-type N-terminal cleavage/methylation domain-containing protein [Ureibacillus sinduriensis]KGR74032.1 hypothetical protein CD33_18720 [Ureibacillus sinduriensis BLB-1 = JCM 15800]
MFPLIKTQKGITLIEVLAVLIIISFISILLIGILFNSNKAHKEEVKSNQELSAVSYAFKVVTKDVRKTIYVEYNKANNQYIFETNDGDIVYALIDNTLYRNDQKLVSNIDQFNLNKIDNSIEIKSSKGESTTLYFRGDVFNGTKS